MPQPHGFSYATFSGGLTSSYKVATGQKDATNEAGSERLPRKGFISHIEFQLASISSATEVSMFLAWDSAGDRPMTPLATQTITTGATTAAKGGVIFNMGVPFNRPSDASSGKIYIVAKTNTGTATAAVRLFWTK
jgi:hypothetical protein